MADRKASEVAAKALKVVGKGIIDMAPDLVKAALGGTVVGVVAGYVATKVKEYVETKDEEKKKQIAKELNGSTELKELKEAAARGEFQPNQPHEYMSAVVFAVKDGDSLICAHRQGHGLDASSCFGQDLLAAFRNDGGNR